MYADTTKLSITALNESSALTLLSSDVKSIAGSLSYLSEIYGASFEVKSAMSLLYKQLEPACLVARPRYSGFESPRRSCVAGSGT